MAERGAGPLSRRVGRRGTGQEAARSRDGGRRGAGPARRRSADDCGATCDVSANGRGASRGKTTEHAAGSAEQDPDVGAHSTSPCGGACKCPCVRSLYGSTTRRRIAARPARSNNCQGSIACQSCAAAAAKATSPSRSGAARRSARRSRSRAKSSGFAAGVPGTTPGRIPVAAKSAHRHYRSRRPASGRQARGRQTRGTDGCCRASRAAQAVSGAGRRQIDTPERLPARATGGEAATVRRFQREGSDGSAGWARRCDR